MCSGADASFILSQPPESTSSGHSHRHLPDGVPPLHATPEIPPQRPYPGQQKAVSLVVRPPSLLFNCQGDGQAACAETNTALSLRPPFCLVPRRREQGAAQTALTRHRGAASVGIT